ncbi:DUF6603 domain-containing protein [Mycolicibacterium porcinum]|uniref:DUF6603 domain-containing protein n=1 Tax=Mycolicibacterium porcinum TaxID=39693 RepID=UPI00084942E0|nr:DUF6603 domain-containing protein [Mycolicibacterium porcinum]ODR25782.1 hypothetical protein BHQ19_10410 [Mycolicibacterium porcinum]
MSNAGPVEILARFLGEALSPLATTLADPDATAQALEDIGMRLPTGALQAGNVPQALQSSAAACGALPAAVTALAAAMAGADDGALLVAAAAVAQRIVATGTAFGKLGAALGSVIQSDGTLTAAQKARLNAVAGEMPARLMHRGVASLVEERLPEVKGFLEITGLIDDTPVAADAADPTLPPHRLTKLRFDRLSALVKNPVEHLKGLYKFGQPDFDGIELFRRIAAVLDRPDASPMLITAPGMPAVLEALMFRIAVEPGALPGLRIRLRTSADQDVADVTEPIGGPWSLNLRSTSRFASGVEVVLKPDSGLHLEPPTAATTLAFTTGVNVERADGKPMILIGQAKGSRLELTKFTAGVPLTLSAAAGAASPEAGLAVEVTAPHTSSGPAGKLVIDTSNSDGFIATLLSGVRLESGFDLNALYSLEDGLRFTGSSTIEIAIPAHVTLGPVTVPTVYLVGGFDGGGIGVEFSADIAARLGPLDVSVNRLGAMARASFPPAGGNAGPIQIDVNPKAPSGAGLSVDAGIVSGGGSLNFDEARKEYSGTLELTFANFLSLKAVGIITTRMPDGSPGFSLLIIITADFGTGIQLGFGFTLLAVGGLLGLNRSMNLPALTEGVRSGAIESVAFPRDVVANASRIISDLRVFFPPRQGTFLIGPMLKLGWGTPTLMSLSLGLIFEIPGNIAGVGVLKVNLPSENAAVVKLQANFIAAVEFDRKRGWFFASLYDSRVLFITIDGGMGVLVATGDDANFVVAVGGFHPQYTPPPLPFPEPRRITVDIVNTSLARIRAEGYFATTSNSVQFGAQAEAFFGLSAMNVSGHIAFDALVQLSPFYFKVNFSAHYSVKVFGVGVWGLRIALEVEGPTPWRARGSAGISLPWPLPDISVRISLSWGQQRDTSLPPVKVLELLAAELTKPQNWRAVPPPQNQLLVSLRTVPAVSDKVVLHPLGGLQVTQQVAPLDIKLDRVGAQKPQDGNRFTLAASSPTFSKRRDVDALFAAAQFEDLSDADRLSRRGFEPRHSGVEMSATGAQLESATVVTRIARYELVTVDTNARRHRRAFSRLARAMFFHFIKGSAVALSVLSNRQSQLRTPVLDGVVIKPEGFAVTRLDNNRPFSSASALFSSEGAARDWMLRTTAGDPGLAGTLQVVPGFEVAR